MKKRFAALDATVIILSAACIALCVALALVKPTYLVFVVGVLLVVGIVVGLNIRWFRHRLARLLHGASDASSAAQGSFAAMSVPVVILTGGSVAWYNDAFRDDVMGGRDVCLLPMSKVVPAFMPALAKEKTGQNIEFGGQRYSVYGSGVEAGDGLFVAYFVNNTTLKRQAGEYLATRPAVMLIAVDTYDEILKEMKESDRARVAGEIDLALEQFIGATTGFLRRISASRYIAVVEERHMQEIVKNRFSILDKVREIGEEAGTVTLSIGVGRLAATLREGEAMAVQALDMALGRGGDQAAVKSAEGFEFYGGISHGVEKRSHVRSRIIANALCDLIKRSDSVIIMGHRMSDLDAVGSAIGVLRICKMCDVPAVIAINSEATLAGPLLKTFLDAGEGHDFIAPDQTLDVITPNTLLIVVDTYQKRLLESQQIYEKCKRVVVIDHHRMAVGHIDNPTLICHEPYASSASELVCELLQFMPKENNITPLEAQALLAGIMLDTRSFALHVGVRTFEAAAWLRSRGAQTADTKLLFNTSKEEYEARAHIVEAAYIYKGCAIALSDELEAGMNVVLPMAANDLLTINGVDASFVAVAKNDGVNISARSMGALNVQVILEPLGGGGHLMMAGAQLQNCTLQDAEHRIREQIDLYRAAQKENTAR